jgi:uncharacterized protein involved in outer membrane biogenesis
VALATAMMGVLVTGEWLGWPFMTAPLERVLSDALQRRVRLSPDAADQGVPTSSLRIHFLGGLQLETSHLEIGAPAWSSAPHVLLAHDVAIEMRYGDLWRAHRGEPLRIKRLRARMLDGQLERLANGRASWQFGLAQVPTDAHERPVPLPMFEELKVTSGTLRYRDSLLALDLDARLSLAAALHISATGHYRQQPLTMALDSSDVLPLLSNTSATVAVPVSMSATIGRASLSFNGRAADALHLNGMSGIFSLKGPSLAAVGDPLGVTLPTTGAFHAEGQLARQAGTWNVVINQAAVGASRLTGAFTYDTDGEVPMLSGHLGGQRFM